MFHVEQLKGQTMSKQEHTPLPWEVAFGSVWTKKEGKSIRIAPMDRDESATSPTERDRNAEFIVHAVNNHDALVDACQAFSDHYSDGMLGIDDAMEDGLDSELFAARVALADVEAGK